VAVLRNVQTGDMHVGDIVLCYGMRVRIDEVRPYAGSNGRPAWSCPGTILNLAEVRAAGLVPPGFLRTRKWDDGRGWATDRGDRWAVQGSNLRQWTVERGATTADCTGKGIPPGKEEKP
jgi:hypothetical protein